MIRLCSVETQRDVRAARDQAAGGLQREQIVGGPLLHDQIAARAERQVIGGGGEPDPGNRARPEDRGAFPGRRIESQLDRSVGVLEGGELIEQLRGIRLVAVGGKRRRGDRRIIRPRPVRQRVVERVIGRDLVGADELQRQRDRAGVARARRTAPGGGRRRSDLGQLSCAGSPDRRAPCSSRRRAHREHARGGVRESPGGIVHEPCASSWHRHAAWSRRPAGPASGPRVSSGRDRLSARPNGRVHQHAGQARCGRGDERASAARRPCRALGWASIPT